MSKLDCHVFGVPESASGHTHPYAHILLPLDQPLTVRLDGQDCHITSNHLGFISPGRYHHCLCSAEIIMINIPAAMIKSSDLELLQDQVCLPLTGMLVPLIQLIKSEVQRNPDSDSVRYLFYYLYDKLVESHGIKSLRYIRDHFGEELSIATLAKLENFNVSYFTDWFKKQTDTSPACYIRQVRMEKAKELLVTTHYRLIDIAAQVGYSSNAAFTRVFTKMAGVSPAAYRQQYRAAAGHPE